MKDKNYRVGIVGYGIVGKGIKRLLKDDVKVIYDPILFLNSKQYFSNLDLVVISVPTNALSSGRANTSLVWKSLEWLGNIVGANTVFLIKSTVPPLELLKMFEEYSNVVFSPEFMGESKYFTPPWKYPDPISMESHTWQVFGGNRKNTSLCVDIFKRRMGVDSQFWQTDIVTASLAKYMENSFFALKVTFCNEWFEIAKAYKSDWNELRELWLLDPRINRNHTLVFPKDRGYGGRCFPKDVKAIIYDSKDVGYKPRLLQSVDKINNSFRRINE